MPSHFHHNFGEPSRKRNVVATSTALIAAAVIGGAAALGTTAIAAGASKKDKGPDLPATPAAPSIQQTGEEMRKDANRRRASTSQTILTGPLQTKDDANVKKTVLG